MKKFLLTILALALFTACERKIDTFSVTKGSADFTKYVSVGNSLTAGYADGVLYRTGQKYSYPNLIAGQLQLAGSGAFVQPIVPSEYGVDFLGAGTKLVLGLKTDCQNVTSLAPIPAIGDKAPLLPVGYSVNNLGIPGAKSFHLLAPHYGDFAGLQTYPPTANPYYCRFSTNPANRLIDEIFPLDPTFFTLWIGNNDVLSYALSGGLADTITSPPFYGLCAGAILQALTFHGAKGAIANIPDITSIPFFTTVPYNGLYLARQSLADSVNYAMSLYQLPFTYHQGYNPFLIPDPTSPHPMFKVRQMVPGELVLLTVPQDSLKCAGMGIISRTTNLPYPIPKQYILTLEDISKIQVATTAYNQIIESLAGTFQIGVVDLNTKMKNLEKGIVWNGIDMSAKFVTGGAFSLDGIHLNPRGNALSANYFIEAINAKYGSTIPYVDATGVPGVIFP